MSKKLLVIIPSLRRGGAERVVTLVSREWARDHAVTIAVFNAREPAFPLADSVRFVDLDRAASAAAIGRPLNLLKRARRLTALIRTETPDQIFSFMEAANFAAILACRLSGRLQSLTVSVRNNPSRFPFYYKTLACALYRWPGRVVAVSQGVRDALVDDLGLPTHKCIAIPNPVDVASGSDGAGQTMAAPLPTGPFVLGVGRLVRQKGFDLLIEAFSKSTAASDHLLLILGDGPERASLSRMARDLGVENKVLMPGSVSSPAIYMRKASCFVLASRYEGWPNVVMEAMACACPVIAFDCQFGPSEIIESDRSGILVRPADVAELSHALSDLTADANKREKLGHAGRIRVSTFDTGSVARRWLENGIAS